MTWFRPCVLLGLCFWISLSGLLVLVESAPLEEKESAEKRNPQTSYVPSKSGLNIGQLGGQMFTDELGPLLLESRYLNDKRNPLAYSFGLGKRDPSPYSFGLGKRDPFPYSFGLGKRLAAPSDYRKLQDSEWKRSSGSSATSRFGFGLGKRSSLPVTDDMDSDDDQVSAENEELTDEEDNVEMEKRSRPVAPEYYTVYIPHSYLNYVAGLNPAFMALDHHPLQQPQRSSTSYKKRDKLFVSSPAVAGSLAQKSSAFGKRLPVYDFGLGK